MSAAKTPILRAIDPQQRLVTIELRGDLTIQDILDTRDAVLADPRYVEGMHWLIDCRVVTQIPRDDESRALGEERVELARSGRVGRTAFVLLTPTGYRFAHAWASCDREGHYIQIFTSPNDALRWLGITTEAGGTGT